MRALDITGYVSGRREGATMPTAVVLVSVECPFAYDLDTFANVVLDRWPGAAFVPASGRIAELSLGQWQVPHRDAWPDMVLIEFDAKGGALSFDSPEDELRAEAIAVSTTVPAFPDDGSVILAEWAPDFVPLRPNTTAEDLLALIV